MKTSEALPVSPNLADLTPEQRALLMLRLRQKKASRGEVEEHALVPVPRDRPLPLSFGQQRLWLVDRWQPGNPAYNLPFSFRMTGRLDGEALRQAFDEVVRRHESLRTAFVLPEGLGAEPVQVICPAEPVPVPRVDLSGLPEALRLPEARWLAAQEARRPFDLEHGRLLRAMLLPLAPEENALVVVVHHIAADAWSIGIFVRELVAFYSATSAGDSSSLPELAIQYADFSVWQRERRGKELEAQLAYWKERLAGASTRLELPTDRPRPLVPSGRGARASFRLSRQLSEDLQGLARRQGATVFMVLLAGFQALLGRLSGQDDISVGTPVAGRNRAELEGLIGFFVNTLVMRASLVADPAFRDLLGQVRDATVSGAAHQDVPFEQVAEAVQPGRDPGVTPLFQVMFTFQNEPAASEALPGVTLSSLTFDAGVAMFDLTLDLKEVEGVLVGGAEHSRDLFDRTTVRRFLESFRTLLEGVVADPGRQVSELPLLSEPERQALLTEWNDTPAPEPGQPFIHRRFEEQARQTPEAPAVVWDRGSWTYGELRDRVASLARCLRKLGVGPEVKVGVCADRSPERVAAVLGVLEAGGAFVPLDPDHPRERLAMILEDSRPAVLLADEGSRDRLPGGAGPVFSLDGEGGVVEDLEPPEVRLDPENAAYVTYTSGSTGRPKGVVVSHLGIAHTGRAWELEYLDRQRIRSVLQVAGFSFDVFTGDLVRALTVGGALVLARAEDTLNPAGLQELLARHRIDFVDLVPAVLRGLLEHLEETGEALDLTVLSVGADAWTADDLERTLRRATPRVRLLNSYGASEASVDTSFFNVRASRPPVGPVVPIGRPFAGSRMVVLDANLRPVPIGVAGELAIGGPNLARGYLGRPDLTAERFIPDPFAGLHGEPGVRLYRTGDRVRHLADGVIEFLGRVDNQIKVRGFRIEPGEVEAALAGHPTVGQAVVVAGGATGSGHSLASFVVPSDPLNPPDPVVLRSWLRERLPEPMVPAAIEILPALPLTPNGKVDRRGLGQRALTLEPQPEEAPAVAPRTPVEEIVGGVFSEVLGGTFGAQDDFFDRGGHSLLATQVMARLRAAFGVEVPLRRLFDMPTVAGLAMEVERALWSESAGEAPSLRPEPRPDGGAGLPLSFGQERLWFLEQLLPGSGIYHMPTAVRLAGPLDASALTRALEAVVARQEILRTSYPPVDGHPVQRIGGAPGVVLPWVDLQALPEARREAVARELVEEASRRPFDLAAAHPWRALLVRLGPEVHALVVVLHHIAADGWSLEVLTRDLAAFYAGEQRPPLPIQYADYAMWQRGWFQGEELDRQLAYWRERLTGLPPALDLPFDRPRPAVPSGRGALRTFVLPELGAPLRALARRSGATLFMALLAGFQSLLSRLSGQGDVALGTPIAGRERVETEGLIGLFLNTLVLRCDLTDDPAFLPDLLPRAREAALGAYAHQALPFERLVEELQPERDLSHSPLFQVMLALQNTPVTGLALPGLSLSPLGAERRAAAFELAFQIFESGDGLFGTLEYATDLFDAATVERTLGHLGTLLAGAVARPEARVSELPLLSNAERHQIGVEWTDTPAKLPGIPWMHKVFEAQARRTPDAVALVAGQSVLTYGELDRRAERLAASLRGRGVGPGVRVVTLFERSPELVVAMLGIWKAGGVFVPFDPASPKERLAVLSEEAGAEVVLRTVEDLDGDGPPPQPSLASREREHDPAYIMFTSGSTGRPKGVVVEYRNLAAHMEATQAALGWLATDSMAWGAPVGFDASLFELWPPLLVGGSCHIVPPGRSADPQAWRELLPRLTRLHAVPGLMRPIVELAREGGPYPRLRTLFVGGEMVPLELLRGMRDVFPQAELRVLYGPTETTVCVTSWPVAPGEVPERSLLGRPFAGTEIRIYDRAGNLVPAGVKGEIWIGGATVGRGYLGREEETAERFMERDGRRFYRTGDLGRLRPWGDLEFHGRGDDQVKIRGFRIELGEVESVLSQAPGLKEVAVAAREDLPGGRGLVAYVVPRNREDGKVDVALLRSFLADRLPSYMVPAFFVPLDRLPRTAHDKVDRRALPAPSLEAAQRVELASRGPVEELLASLFAEVLELPGVGPDDGFFDLGGHSLLATRLVSRIREVLQIELPLRTVFEKPTVASLAREVEARLRAGEGSQAAPPIVPVPRGLDLPLSFSQERLWFLERLQPGTSTYNVPLAVAFQGTLDLAALHGALRALVSRHEALRTRFPVSESGSPVQQVEPVPARVLPLVDLAGLPEATRAAEARALAGEQAERPFDLENGLPLRATLVRLGKREHLALLTLHHIASDAWSVGVLVREVSALYQAAVQSRPEPLPALPVQYADFAVWQRQWLTGQALEEQLAYWRERLAGASPVLDLPFDRPRPAVQTFRGDSLSLRLGGAALASSLRSLSRRSGSTLFMTLLAAFSAALHRLSGSEDVVVGTPSANRNRAEIEGLIGFFVNTLVLRQDLSGNPGFLALLARVREGAVGAFTHPDLPFEKLVAEMSPERHLSHSPLFQVLFQLENTPAVGLELGGDLTLSAAPTGARSAEVDLVVTLREGADGLWGDWRFHTDLFDAPTVERMGRLFEILLEGVAADPEQQISELPYLTRAESHQLLLEWNPPGDEAPEITFPELFEAQAARTPDAAALVGEDRVLTYGELKALSDRGAEVLAGRGVGPESVVALLAGRGLELVVAILAVQKVGGVWLPLDPGQPEGRLARILESSGAALVVVGGGEGPLPSPPPLRGRGSVSSVTLAELLSGEPSERLADEVPSGRPGELSEPGRAGAPSPARQRGGGLGRGPKITLDPRNLAYLISTSGSTGEPKLVQVEHRGLLNHLLAKVTDLHLTAADTVAQTASQAFDISIWQSLAVLLVGGRVRVYPDEVSHDPGRLLDAVARDGVTVLETVPSLLAGLLDLFPEPLSLRWLISTGEALPPELARRWRTRYPEVPLINAYGPSEASDRVSHHVVEDADTGMPIGRPLPNLRLFVTDGLEKGLTATPIGVAGELCIGGVGVGRGYLGDPARTAEAFVPDPSGTLRGEPGARLYRTSDLARLLADGRLELLGRRDYQVKIRGFRIETGEIEAVLGARPEVREAVVVARGGRLVAYVVPSDPMSVPDDLIVSLKVSLREVLPGYMIPAAFVVLEALPLNRSGKVDRRALPDPSAERRESGLLPATPLEALLAGMWRDVIGDTNGDNGLPIGVHDSFFDLGGDSIKGAIFVNRLERRLGEEVQVAALFEAPTLASLATELEARYPDAVARMLSGGAGDEGEGRLTLLARRVADGEAAPLSFAQERLWFLHQLDPEGATYNMFELLLLRGALDVPALESTLREIFRRHETLRTRFVVAGGQPVAEVGPVPAEVLRRIDLARLGEGAQEEARRLARAEALRPFDLERGPVVRVLLVDLKGEDHLLVLNTHHIACDGWSMGLWAREIELLYSAFASGRPSPLPDPPVQYGDFAAWQRSWLQGTALEAQVAYWRERLRDAPPYLELPLDHPRPPFQTYRGAASRLRLPADLADRLRSLSGRHNASLFMTLLAGFYLHLKRLSGQEDVLVGSPIAGRTRPEVEGLIGCFLNTLVLRTDLSGNPTFLELLRRVRETALGAFSYQDVPFEKLLEELRPERDTSRPSLFQVLFNMLNAPRAEMDLPGLAIGRFGTAELFAKFDLTLYVSEEEGLELDLVYNADLFDPFRMEEMLRQYRLLLEQAAAEPEATIDRYSLLTPEAASLLPNPAASVTHPWPGAVQDLFAAWARRTPGKVAIVDRDGEWTYAELDLAVRKLAARLQADGILAGDRVAIYAHRSAALAWVLLGVLKAGAVFTILDPIYPAPRLLDRLRMAEPKGLLRLEGAGPLPPEIEQYVEAQGYPCRLTLPSGSLERATAPVADQPLPDPEAWPEMGAYDVASVAFTSGSTGLPKGIVQTHGSMSYFLPWHRETLGFNDTDRHTMLSGLAHDPLHRDTFYCLGTGATLYVPDPDRIGQPGYLAGWMGEQRVTITNMTPAMGQLLTELPPGASLPDLPEMRCVILAGDLLTRQVVERIRCLAPRAVFLNVYGATESQRALSFHIVEEDRDRRLKQTLPLGQGKKGSQLLVLTSASLRAGVGELGEVVIRSPHLAQGYLKDEAQTRAKYGLNPFTQEPGDRIYRTGDLGRYLPDGEVEAAGRADQQVKIRGFRVEPGEIEAELVRDRGVREAVVVARSIGDQGERQLVAYLVMDRERPAAVPDLRERLRQNLPAYMVPAAWVTLEKLPVNPNGKVDRVALPSPEAAERGDGPAAVPPRDELERRLAKVWEGVLGTSPVGVTDDFFDLGGHSLLAVRLMARVESDLGRSLPLSALFQSGTVEGLAALLRQQDEDGLAESTLVRLRTGGSRPPLFLVHPAGGRVHCYVDLARRLDPERPVYGLQDLAPAGVGRSLAGLAADYVERVLAVEPEGPYYLAGWSFGGRVAFEMARQLDGLGKEVAFLGMIDTGLVTPAGQPDGGDEVSLLREVLWNVPPELLDDLRPGMDDPLGVVLDRVRREGYLPEGFDLAEARRQLRIIQEHLEVARRDRPEPYAGRLVFFAAEQQPVGTKADPDHGWAGLAGATEITFVPGDHVSMIYDTLNIEVLAERLEARLEEAERDRERDRKPR